MLRNLMVAGCTLAAAAFTVAATNPPVPANLTAAQIVDRNVAARGGLQAWRAVQAIQETGKMGAGGNNRSTQPQEIPGLKHPGKNAPLPSTPRLKEEAQLPFTLDLERPRKLRLEILFHGQTAVQVYDGANGWKLRPYLNRLEVEPYTADEQKLAAMETELDGPLVDYAAKGTRIDADGMEKVEDHDTYKLKLTQKDGRVTHVWVDTKTFLEVKVEGMPRHFDGKMHPVEVYYRDYREVNGLEMPFVLETHLLPLGAPVNGHKEVTVPAERIEIDKITVNPKLDASLFTKPEVQMASNHHP